MHFGKQKKIEKLVIIITIIFTSIILNLGTNLLASSISQKENVVVGQITSQPNGFVKYNATTLYSMEKLANITDSLENSTQIDIEIPPNNWNITDLDFKFTNLSINQEKVTIEDLGDGFRGLESNNVEGLAMQLKITESTIVYSIDIFGYKYEGSTDPGTIYFEIEGWDSGNNEPNGIIYGTPVELNMSTIPQWYTQNFPNPIELTPGDYAIVIDGSNIMKSDYYYWWINNSKSGSNLYMSEYSRRMITWDWREEYEKVFLHKINKGVYKPYFPSEVNLTVNIDGKEHPIMDGTIKGEGSLILNDTNFNVESELLNIPLSNNQSLKLNFNLNYSINLYNQLSIDSSIEIGDLLTNKWCLCPEFENYSCESYCYKILIPENWENIQIFKDDVNVSSDSNIIFENQSLMIFDDLITEGATWEILAENNPKNVTINLSNTVFQPAEDIEFEVDPAMIGGKLGLVIQDAHGTLVYIDEKSVQSSAELFSYLIRSDASDGIWRAYVYWFNTTDAGFNSIIFEVNVPAYIPPPDPFLIILLIGLGGAITGGTFGAYSVYKIRKTNKEQKRQQLIQKFKDLTNLEYIIITDKVSSLDLFSQSFKKKSLDLTLVSGFLTAIRSFGIELTGSSEHSQVIKLEYQDSKIIMTEYKQFRLIFIMKETPSNEFLEALSLTAIELDEKFGRFLKDFDGDVGPFKYVERLLIQKLGTGILYPLKISDDIKVNLSSSEKDLLKRVNKYLKSNKSTIFKVLYFINNDEIHAQEVKLFSNLIKRRIFQPVIGDLSKSLD
jgi:hypothetical protein